MSDEILLDCVPLVVVFLFLGRVSPFLAQVRSPFVVRG